MAKSPLAVREKRLAAALKLNLKRRKAGTGSASRRRTEVSPLNAEHAGAQKDPAKPAGDPPPEASV